MNLDNAYPSSPLAYVVKYKPPPEPKPREPLSWCEFFSHNPIPSSREDKSLFDEENPCFCEDY